MTLAEAKQKIKEEENRLRVLMSISETPIRQAYAEHRRTLDPLLSKLRRLRDRMETRLEVIAAHEARILEIEKSLRTLKERARVIKMLRLIGRANGMKKKQVQALIKRYRLTNARATDLKYIHRGLANDIVALCELPTKFEKREAELTKAINAQCFHFERWLRDRAGHQEFIDQCHDRLVELRKEEARLGGGTKVAKLGARAEMLVELLKAMPEEFRNAALERMGIR